MPFAAAGAIAGVASAGIGLAGSAAQAGATKQAAAQAQKQFEQTRADLTPYREAGLPTLQAQNALLGLGGQDAANAAMANFQQSPGYQFQYSEGLRGIDAGAAAKGLLRSGATLKAEETFGQGLANQDFGNYYNRLMGLTSLGAQAAGAGATSNIAAGNAAQSAGNTQASIYGDISKGLQTGVNQLLGPTPGGGSGGASALFPGGTQYYGNNTNFLNSGTVGSAGTPSYTGVYAPGYS